MLNLLLNEFKTNISYIVHTNIYIQDNFKKHLKNSRLLIKFSVTYDDCINHFRMQRYAAYAST